MHEAITERAEAARLRELLFPNPIALSRSRLAVAVTRDVGLSVCSWMATKVAALFFAGLGAGYKPEAALAAATRLDQMGKAAAAGFLFGVLATLLGFTEGLYQEALPHTRPVEEQVVAGKSSVLAALITASYFLLAGGLDLPLPWFAVGTALSYLSLIAGRRWFKASLLLSTGTKRVNVLIVGAAEEGRGVARFLEEHPEQGRVVCGFVDDRGRQSFGVLGKIDQLIPIARAKFADEIIVALPPSDRAVDWVVEQGRQHHLDVRIVPEFFGLRPREQWIERWNDIPVITLHRERLPREELLVKRLIDVAGTTTILFLLWPLLAVIAIVIRLDSGGPALYRAVRAGRKGEPFLCYKFRTMHPKANAERDGLRRQNERAGPCFKIARDPRITRVGSFLRRYSLDELPQLWNVLRGEMSLVGPRPHPIDDYERYTLEHLRRLDVTPGMTGLWQVTARQDPSFETNLALDLEYIERWSVGLDLRLLWKTAEAVLRGTGA
jgi:exopolysaccharide biosynthesis polyprenyl glycosylphosphotransferase